MQNLMAVINANPQQCADLTCVFTGQTANPSATAYIVPTTAGNGLATTKLTLGAITNGGTFAVSSTSTGITAATTTTTGVANVSVSGLGGYSVGQPVTCSLSGGGGSGATCGVNLTFFTPAPGYAPAYGATPGWDFATGLGSVNAYNLVFNTAW